MRFIYNILYDSHNCFLRTIDHNDYYRRIFVVGLLLNDTFLFEIRVICVFVRVRFGKFITHDSY